MRDIKFVSFAFWFVGVYCIFEIIIIQRLDFFEYKMFKNMYQPVTANIIEIKKEQYTTDWRGYVRSERDVAIIIYKIGKNYRTEKIVIDSDKKVNDTVRIAINKKTGKVLSKLKFNFCNRDLIGTILGSAFIIIGLSIKFIKKRIDRKIC